MVNKNDDFDFRLNGILIGDECVGRSALVERLIDGTFHSQTRATIGVESKSHTAELSGRIVKSVLWDCGQARFQSLRAPLYSRVSGAIVVYDVSTRSTFDGVSRWLRELTKFGGAELTIMLIGNKCDLERPRAVTYEEGRAFARKIGAMFIETSARDGTNVERAFRKWAMAVCVRGGERVYCTRCAQLREETGDETAECEKQAMVSVPSGLSV